MSRSNYSDDIDDYRQLVLWRGAVRSAIRGRRGQAFLHDLLTASVIPSRKTPNHGEYANRDLPELQALCSQRH